MAGKINQEKNYISAVIYLGDKAPLVKPFIKTLLSCLGRRFEHYELIFVDDASRDGSNQVVRDTLAKLDSPPPVTIINMSLCQGLEHAMNAGLDIAIGDFVYEFDTMEMPYPEEMITKAYDACLTGNDIVSVAPNRNRGLVSSAFYHIFNSTSQSKYKLHTDAFRLLSRRAINRIHAISSSVAYRKAAYAASGLKIHTLTFEGGVQNIKEHLRTHRAVDSLALYTDAGFKVSLMITLFMLILMLASLTYTVIIYLNGVRPVPGWTSLMLLLTGGFFGIFAIFSIILKYLTLIVELIFKKQNYLVESVEKLV